MPFENCSFTVPGIGQIKIYPFNPDRTYLYDSKGNIVFVDDIDEFDEFDVDADQTSYSENVDQGAAYQTQLLVGFAKLSDDKRKYLNTIRGVKKSIILKDENGQKWWYGKNTGVTLNNLQANTNEGYVATFSTLEIEPIKQIFINPDEPLQTMNSVMTRKINQFLEVYPNGLMPDNYTLNRLNEFTNSFEFGVVEHCIIGMMGSPAYQDFASIVYTSDGIPDNGEMVFPINPLYGKYTEEGWERFYDTFSASEEINWLFKGTPSNPINWEFRDENSLIQMGDIKINNLNGRGVVMSNTLGGVGWRDGLDLAHSYNPEPTTTLQVYVCSTASVNINVPGRSENVMYMIFQSDVDDLHIYYNGDKLMEGGASPTIQGPYPPFGYFYGSYAGYILPWGTTRLLLSGGVLGLSPTIGEMISEAWLNYKSKIKMKNI
jgi:hypothetical protein